MRLVEVRLRNFRAYSQEVAIPFEALTVLVGRNDAGKSSILDALDVFFNETTLEKDDCTIGVQPPDITIACVFDELPPEVILDEQFPTNLRSENLLRGDGRLEIRKTYNCSAAKAKPPTISAFAFHPSADGLSDLLSLKIADLRQRARARGVDTSEVNEAIKAQLRQAILQQAGNLELLDQEVSLNKEGGKEIWDQLRTHMPVYALFKSDRTSTDQDAEAQDPMKAAIKEAIQGRQADLADVLGDIQIQLQRVAERTVEKIREMSPDLARELTPTVKAKNWESLFGVSLTGDDSIPINKRGSGTRRLVLLNFFRAKAEDDSVSRSTGVIYAVEEPETSQHPDHQAMLLDALQEMAEEGRCQVILTTHTPTLARRVDTKCLRLVTRQGGRPHVEYGVGDATLIGIRKTLGVLADHDVKAFLGVEGKNDVAFLKRISRVLSRDEVDIPDLEVEEASGRLVFVSLGGSNMDMWINTLEGLRVPEFYITDRDVSPPANPKYWANIEQWTRRGCRAWATSSKELENYLSPGAIAGVIPGYAGQGLPFEDVPLLTAKAVHSQAAGAVPWDALTVEAIRSKKSQAKKTLNYLCVDRMTPELLTQTDPGGDIRGWLRQVGLALRA